VTEDAHDHRREPAAVLPLGHVRSRIGSKPVTPMVGRQIGTGTWADAGCGVSTTGWGEFYVRAAAVFRTP